MDPSSIRLAAQWLAVRRPRGVVEVVRHLLAVQGQELQGARLAVRARAEGVTARDVDDALADRSLVLTWLNRGTLHLVTAEDYAWLHPLTAPRLRTAVTHRLGQVGVSPQQAVAGVDVVVRAVAEHGTRTRHELKEHLDAAGVPTQGQALIHVLALTSLEGHVVRGPVQQGEHAYVLVRDWLGPPPAPLDAEEALGRLATRYLAAHHPATDRDLAAWAGITLTEARRGLAVAADPADPADDHAPASPTRLLGPFDPVLHGWPDRAWILGPYGHVVTVNGIFRPSVLVDGRVIGTWTLPKGRVALDLFEDVPAAVRAALDADAQDVHRFLDGVPARGRRHVTRPARAAGGGV